METEVEIEYDSVKHTTNAAMLLVIEDKERWLPLSVINDHDEDHRIVYVQEWFALKEGLI